MAQVFVTGSSYSVEAKLPKKRQEHLIDQPVR
jgi:hypothetical protein